MYGAVTTAMCGHFRLSMAGGSAHTALTTLTLSGLLCTGVAILSVVLSNFWGYREPRKPTPRHRK